jgi:5-formyltetrahydrofolate cyclo-ligase
MRKDATVSRPVLIGVAHDLQKVEQIIPEDRDVRLDMVVTDQAIYR